MASIDRVSLSDTDVVAAHEISTIASTNGLSVRQLALTQVEIAIDAMDIAAVIPFRRAILGYIDEPPGDAGEPVTALIDPAGVGPSAAGTADQARSAAMRSRIARTSRPMRSAAALPAAIT